MLLGNRVGEVCAKVYKNLMFQQALLPCRTAATGLGWRVGESGSAGKTMLNWVFYGVGDRSWGATTLCPLRYHGEKQRTQ